MVANMSSLLSRRECLKRSLCGAGLVGWLPTLARIAQADERAGTKRPHRACILLWMGGGPSQLDTFDPKPGHANGGQFKAIETAVPGISICEHLPEMAKSMQDLAIIRSMSTKEGDHGRATYHLHTGYRPQGAIQYPTLGSLVSHELGHDDAPIPNYVSILPQTVFNSKAYAPGFLGPKRAPLVVGDAGRRPQPAPADGKVAGYGPPLEVKNLGNSDLVRSSWYEDRLNLLNDLEDDFASHSPGLAAESHRTAIQQAVRLMRSEARQAFELDEEPAALREKYGKHRFGQSCLLARRLIERGVAFVEISHSDNPAAWDTHNDGFTQLKPLLATLDQGWSTLLSDLRDRGLLESTLVVWMGEFGRTPVINPQAGRDHFPTAWSTVLSGGGIKGGQVYGQTSAAGDAVTDKPVAVNQFLATVCRSLGIDHTKQNPSNVGRPIRLVEPEAMPIDEIVMT